MAAPCRLLILNERDPAHPSAGGAEVHVREVFSRLVARGFEAKLLASSFPGAERRADFDGIEVERLGPLGLYYPRVLRRAIAATRRGDCDVVVECLNKVPFFSPLWATVPVLALCHHLFGTTAFRQVAWPIAAAVWLAERPVPRLYRRHPFVTISESSRLDLVARGVSAGAVRVVPCGVRPCAAAVDTVRPRPRRVVFLGRLEPYKQVEVMMQAVARLEDRFPDAELLVIGRGSARAGLEREAQRLGLGARTRFAGFVGDVERDGLLASCRLGVCPSVKEGWGLTVIESNAAGVPVVASDAPGLRDSVRAGETGYLVPVGDVAAFAERIGRVLGDDALAVRLSQAAFAWSRRFDWDRAADGIEQAIDEVRHGR